ncbi:MAG TPA: hypothetical protein VHZ03_46300 [Trebonia sp.]|nr:hypothetical protein [Trebonia sp.]
MHALIAILAAAIAAGAAVVMNAVDRRAACALPRPVDATAAVAFTLEDWPTPGEAAIAVIITNPGPVPVLAALSLRRAPLPGGRPRTVLARWTSRPRYRPGRQAAMAAVQEESMGGLCVPVSRHRRFRLVIVIGQSDGRLLVTSAPVKVGRPGKTAP